MWTKSQNGEDHEPQKVEEMGNAVMIRRNIKRVPESEEMSAHYEYEEWQMSKEQYEVYQNFETQINEQADALVELAGMLAEMA